MSGGRLNLNPDVPPRRNSISGCKCLMLTIGIVLSLATGAFLIISFTSAIQNFFIPHKTLYHNMSLETASHYGTVVQPLVTRQQAFDIAVTVWLRSSEKSTHRGSEYDTKESGKTQEAEEQGLTETLLYSDVVFRGMHLTDKHVFSTVNFSMPTAIL